MCCFHIGLKAKGLRVFYMVDDDKAVCSWKSSSRVVCPLHTSQPSPRQPQADSNCPSAACIYRTGHSFTIHTKCGGTIFPGHCRLFSSPKGSIPGRPSMGCHFATTFSSPVFHVSLKLYVDSDSKNMMVVFCNDGLVTL